MRTLKKKQIQIYIEPKQDRVIDVVSKARGVSKAEIIRLSINKFLSELPLENDPAMKIIGLGKSGKGDLSEKHDKYIARYYHSKRKKQ